MGVEAEFPLFEEAQGRAHHVADIAIPARGEETLGDGLEFRAQRDRDGSANGHPSRYAVPAKRTSCNSQAIFWREGRQVLPISMTAVT